MKSSITGTGSLMAKLARIPTEVNAPIRRTIANRALDVEGDAKISITSGTKSGRIYKRGKSRVHQASAAGESPASDTGRLASAVSHKIVNGGLEAEIGVFGKVVDSAGKGRNYAKDLEFGTSKMAARPFLFPALEKNREKIKRTLNDAINKALKNV